MKTQKINATKMLEKATVVGRVCNEFLAQLPSDEPQVPDLKTLKAKIDKYVTEFEPTNLHDFVIRYCYVRHLVLSRGFQFLGIDQKTGKMLVNQNGIILDFANEKEAVAKLDYMSRINGYEDEEIPSYNLEGAK